MARAQKAAPETDATDAAGHNEMSGDPSSRKPRKSRKSDLKDVNKASNSDGRSGAAEDLASDLTRKPSTASPDPRNVSVKPRKQKAARKEPPNERRISEADVHAFHFSNPNQAALIPLAPSTSTPPRHITNIISLSSSAKKHLTIPARALDTDSPRRKSSKAPDSSSIPLETETSATPPSSQAGPSKRTGTGSSQPESEHDGQLGALKKKKSVKSKLNQSFIPDDPFVNGQHALGDDNYDQLISSPVAPTGINGLRGSSAIREDETGSASSEEQIDASLGVEMEEEPPIVKTKVKKGKRKAKVDDAAISATAVIGEETEKPKKTRRTKKDEASGQNQTADGVEAVGAAAEPVEKPKSRKKRKSEGVSGTSDTPAKNDNPTGARSNGAETPNGVDGAAEEKSKKARKSDKPKEANGPTWVVNTPVDGEEKKRKKKKQDVN